MALPVRDDSLIDEFRESEGSCSAIDDPDFIPGLLFTTSNTESVYDPIFFNREEAIKTVFDVNEAVNLNFFITNIGYRNFDEEYPHDASLITEWTVTAEDGSIMASGSTECNNEVYSSYSEGYLANLNTIDGEVQSWPAGRYTVTVKVNPDHAIREAYYLNNIEAACEFEIR